jgi:glycosyl transferase family 2
MCRVSCRRVAVPLISVLLPITLPWSGAAASLASLLAQIDAPPFEILVLDGNRDPIDPVDDPRVRWFHFPNCNTFQLRAAGIAVARGTIIAVMEDHCVAATNWVAQIAKAHDADRSIAVLGPTANHPDAAISAIDRANFILTFAGQNSKRIDLDIRALPVPTNLSFKIDALSTRDVTPSDLEYRWFQELRKLGQIGIARSVVLQHNQSLGAIAPAVHFASGRSFGASVRDAPWRYQLQWWAALPLLPLRLFLLTIPDLVRGAGGNPATFADFLCLGLLIAANIVGQTIGAVAGPGASRRRL